MQPVHIAPAVEADYEWAARLMVASEPWITLQRDLKGSRALLLRPGTELFIARDEAASQPLGFILLAAHGLAGSPYIAALGVASGTRGQSVGSQLMDFAEQRFSSRGHLFLLVSSFNLRAQKFYRTHGYVSVGEVEDYIVSGHSELIFYKRLA